MTSTDVVVVSDTPKTPAQKVVRTRTNRRHDWDDIKTTYVEGYVQPKKNSNDPEERKWLTLNETADKHGVNPSLLRRKAAEDRWGEQRTAYQARVAHSRRQRRIISLGKDAVEFDGKALGVAKLGITMVQARLGEIARDAQVQSLRRQDADKRAAMGLVVDPEDYATVIDARELTTLASAATQFQSLAKVALGEDVQRVEHTGANGDAIEVDVDAEVTHTVKAEMGRDDPARMKALMDGLQRAGLFDDNNNVIDGELEEDEDDDDDVD